ncbi:neurogenic locus Notch protein [Elysia marginata]|uniref:Neurogenic locus Notch protein n=1 Tax=Elysia marginata TaxID=1093978 RepID=A0AAV4EFV0_9GAST|nr:neurogenic locus Notch protein [Elysia marginata]
MHSTFITEVRNLLEWKAPKVYVPRYILLDVGHLLLIMDRYRITGSSTMVTATTLRTPSLTSTLATMTSSIEMTPSMTLTPSTTTGGPTTPSSSVGIGSTLSYKFGLADFIYTLELVDPGSNRFKFLMGGFCKDMDRYFRQSFLQNFYLSCKIDAFR